MSVMNRIVSACLPLVALVACSTQTEVVKMYEDAAVGDTRYEHVLIVSVASDVGQRRRLEELITGHLGDAGVAATAAHTRIGLTPTILQDDIDSAARELSADAILITHIVSVETSARRVEGRVDLVSECRGGDPVDYFLYDHREIKEPDSVRFAHTVVAVTNLYDVDTGRRMWTIQSTCFEKASMDEVLREEATAIVRQLQVDALIG